MSAGRRKVGEGATGRAAPRLRARIGGAGVVRLQSGVW